MVKKRIKWPRRSPMTTVDDSLTGRALALVDLVQYQPGAVVSRTLIDKKIGTLTLFAFDEGQGLSEHTAPYDAFVQIVDGAADITIAGAGHRVAAGQMIIMPANVPHALRSAGRFKMLLVMIRA
ncbi:MAG: cupin domain-containing protein [Desulfomicrobium escambiense]|nr:cupin domain-containing protein [Desulfomicrobium escambiense]